MSPTFLIVSRDADAALALARAALLAPDALVVGGAGALQVGELGAAAAGAGGLVEELVVVAVEHVALAPARALVLLDLWCDRRCMVQCCSVKVTTDVVIPTISSRFSIITY